MVANLQKQRRNSHRVECDHCRRSACTNDLSAGLVRASSSSVSLCLAPTQELGGLLTTSRLLAGFKFVANLCGFQNSLGTGQRLWHSLFAPPCGETLALSSTGCLPQVLASFLSLAELDRCKQVVRICKIAHSKLWQISFFPPLESPTGGLLVWPADSGQAD